MLQHDSTIQPKLPRHPLDDSIGFRHGSYDFKERDLVELRELLGRHSSKSWSKGELQEIANNLFLAVSTLVSCQRALEARRRATVRK